MLTPDDLEKLSRSNDVPPEGSIVADWYEKYRPEPAQMLHVIAHLVANTKDNLDG